MSKPKFTPGPWVVESENHGAWGVNFMIVSAENRLIDIAEMVVDPADAHLIATAPELHDLVAEAVELISGDLTGSEWKKACHAFVKKGRAALAKAEGKT